MRLHLPGGMVLRAHPLFLFFLLLYCIAGQGKMICAYVLTLLLHETGHCCAAMFFHLPVAQLDLTPFGGAMQIEGSNHLTGKRGFLLAAAGILVNILCLPPAFLLVFYGNGGLFFTYFLLANAIMLLINLLPVLPLDGGRMLLSLISAHIDPARAFYGLKQAGKLLSLVLILWSIALAFRGIFRPKGALLGCFLLHAASMEGINSVTRYLSSLYSRRRRIEKGEILPVISLCVKPSLPLFRLLPQLGPEAYHMIALVQDDGFSIVGTLTEAQLLSALLSDPSVPLSQLLDPD